MNDEELIAALLSDPTIGFHEAVKQAEADKHVRAEREPKPPPRTGRERKDRLITA